MSILEQVASMRRERMSIHAIAKKLGVRKNRVQAAMRTLGLKTFNCGVDEAPLRELWADKSLSVMEIAVRLGTTEQSVWGAAKKYGLPPRGRRVWIDFIPQQTVAPVTAPPVQPDADDAFAGRLFQLWHDKSLSFADIARELGLRDKALYDAVKKYRLPPRDRRCMAYRDETEDVSHEEDAASAESLELSPYVKARIRELRIGMPVAS